MFVQLLNTEKHKTVTKKLKKCTSYLLESKRLKPVRSTVVSKIFIICTYHILYAKIRY